MVKSYHTKQRAQILEFLSTDRTKQYTVEEIIEGLSSHENAPGKSTVYRLINRLTEEGLVLRFVRSGTHKFVYQAASCSSPSHFHLQCTNCGKTICLNSTLSLSFHDDVLSKAGFAIDDEKTMLLGKCSGCK